jgi:hypothetical protein
VRKILKGNENEEYLKEGKGGYDIERRGTNVVKFIGNSSGFLKRSRIHSIRGSGEHGRRWARHTQIVDSLRVVVQDIFTSLLSLTSSTSKSPSSSKHANIFPGNFTGVPTESVVFAAHRSSFCLVLYF